VTIKLKKDFPPYNSNLLMVISRKSGDLACSLSLAQKLNYSSLSIICIFFQCHSNIIISFLPHLCIKGVDIKLSEHDAFLE
jgi:hypothetical protein